VTASVETTIGGNNPKICESGGCVEALLDIEYIEGVAHPIPLTVIYSSTCASFFAFCVTICVSDVTSSLLLRRLLD
jgi:hypothetical protein